MARPPWQPVSLADYLKALFGQPNLSLVLAAFLMGLMSNTLASLLGERAILGVPGNVAITTALGFLIVILFLYLRRANPGIEIEMVEHPPAGKQGLILLLSTLSPLAQDSSAVARIQQAAPGDLQENDFAPLWQTNLKPALRALEYHLEHGPLWDCWLISTGPTPTTDGKQVPGSAEVAPVLERWFKFLHPDSRVIFHYKDFVISPRNYISLWRKVDEIFRTSYLRPQSIICDITGGLKPMSIGVALACLGGNRDMQYMASERDWQGLPLSKGQMAPILIRVNPQLVFSERSHA